MKNGFTLIEVLAVIVILGVIMAITIPTIGKVMDNRKKDSFFLSAKTIVRGIEYNDISNTTFTRTNLASLNLTDISADDYDLDNSYVYVENGIYKINLVGKGNFAGLYACGVAKNSKSSMIGTTACEAPVIIGAPELIAGIIPVYYDDVGGVWKKADSNNLSNSWYDYSNQKWANAVTVVASGNQTRAYYENAAVGTTIDIADINTMLVWIPRFKYKLFNTAGDSTTMNVDGSYGPSSSYGINCGTSTCIDVQLENKNETKSTGTANGQYLTHPAFTLGTTELNGIWVGKFASSSLTVGTNDNSVKTDLIIKPNIKSWTNINVANAFNSVQSMGNVNNQYGFDNTQIDSHMMKSIEWGAVAYLEASIYGKQGNSLYTGANIEVYTNNSSVYTTGCSAGTPSANSFGGCQYAYNNIVDRGSGTGAAGVGASTTGNIYGVYDVSGLSQYVMGNETAINTGSGTGWNPSYANQPMGGASGFNGPVHTYNGPMDPDVWSNVTSGIPFPSQNYYDSYSWLYYDYINLGDATGETIKWYNDAQLGEYVSFDREFPDYPWVIRGGRSYGNDTTGMFSADISSGTATAGIGFHAVVTIK